MGFQSQNHSHICKRGNHIYQGLKLARRLKKISCKMITSFSATLEHKNKMILVKNSSQKTEKHLMSVYFQLKFLINEQPRQYSCCIPQIADICSQTPNFTIGHKLQQFSEFRITYPKKEKAEVQVSRKTQNWKTNDNNQQLMFFMMANIKKVTMPILKFCNIKPDFQAYSSAKTLATALPTVIYSQGSFYCHYFSSIDKIIL